MFKLRRAIFICSPFLGSPAQGRILVYFSSSLLWKIVILRSVSLSALFTTRRQTAGRTGQFHHPQVPPADVHSPGLAPSLCTCSLCPTGFFGSRCVPPPSDHAMAQASTPGLSTDIISNVHCIRRRTASSTHSHMEPSLAHRTLSQIGSRAAASLVQVSTKVGSTPGSKGSSEENPRSSFKPGQEHTPLDFLKESLRSWEARHR